MDEILAEETPTTVAAEPTGDYEASHAVDKTTTFADLGLASDLLESLEAANFRHPTDIQRELIPMALAGRDCLGQARTGTGKTAAFALPVMQLVKHGEGIQALVLVPTRELARQVEEHFRLLGKSRGLKTALAYGGVNISTQAKALPGAEILIATPGRVLDLHGRRLVSFNKIRHVVLDEVDRMLDIGFRDDIRRILKLMPKGHQTIFVSATIDDEIRKLAKSYMHDPAEVNVSQDEITVDRIQQGYVTTEKSEKFDTLLKFLKSVNPTLAIVFCKMKVTARRVAEKLQRAGVKCVELHGDLMQKKREKVMEKFRAQHVQVLVATDLVSRGVDVMQVSHIVNYDVPEDTAVYVHRIGRTARMGQSGYAVSFVQPDEGYLLTEIEKLINRELPQLEGDWTPKRPRPTVVEPPPAAAPVLDANGNPPLITPRRLLEPVARCKTIESYGIPPQPRTLGSRFRSNRRRR
jgi:ATP-dependent RNA helicase DeaD